MDYSVAQNPRDRQWYVIGRLGRNRNTGRMEYMPVSDAYSTKDQAVKQITHLRVAERSARLEIAV